MYGKLPLTTSSVESAGDRFIMEEDPHLEQIIDDEEENSNILIKRRNFERSSLSDTIDFENYNGDTTTT